MMTLLDVFYAFLLENWLAVVAGAALVGGWLLVCRELCLGAEPELGHPFGQVDWVRAARRRPVLSSQRQCQHTQPRASFRIRRS